ncbi:PaaI family thioesterase [Corynebacterium sp. TAE3-ERU12]|nr:PaaI family thioesterase [Corynebacterium sp. TAE3-ERU12]
MNFLVLRDIAAQRELTDDELTQINTMLSQSTAHIDGDLSQVFGMEALTNVRYRAVGPKGVTLSVQVDYRHLQPAGQVNGGMLAFLGETAGSIAGYIALGPDSVSRVVGANNNTDFIRPCFPGDTITSQATAIHLGRTSQLWDVRHTNQHGKLLACTTLRLAVLTPPQK